MVGRVAGIEHLMRPRSVVIIGMSSKPGAPSAGVLKNLLANGYQGDIYLVGRSGGLIDGRPCRTSLDEIPERVELAIITIPANAVRDAIADCIRCKVKSAVCFASGFAEMGEEGRLQQQEIGRMAREGGLALIGPNCVGYFNYVDTFAVMLVELEPIKRLAEDAGPAIAVVAQSGGIGAHIAASLGARGLPISYMMTTGNEADLGLSELIEFFARDPHTEVVLVYAEQIRRPADLLAAAKVARSTGTAIAIYHPGRSARAQSAAASHTGALAGDYAAMRTIVEHSGIAMVDTLEQLIDLGPLLLRFPHGTLGGLGVITGSGAICAIIQDYSEVVGLLVPALDEAQAEVLRQHLPEFTTPRNPLDLGTVIVWQPDLVRLATIALLADKEVGSVMISFPYADGGLAVAWMEAIVAGSRASTKPLIYVIHNEDIGLPSVALEIARENKVVIMRSPERAMRALAALNAYRRFEARIATEAGLAVSPGQTPKAKAGRSTGALTEWVGKEVLASVGVPIPRGRLATTAEEAVEISRETGFPVVLKAQAASLAHKSDAGGVLLNIMNESALRDAWSRMYANVEKAKPGLKLEGLLVEAMSPRGLELVVGARRDPQWGPILLLGIGGVWIEAFQDIRLLPATATDQEIIEELFLLRGAKLLRGFRGAPPVDVAAVATVARKVAALMSSWQEIAEIDINPLVAFPEGEGVIALDALIVLGS